jgi:hypothetical protein
VSPRRVPVYIRQFSRDELLRRRPDYTLAARLSEDPEVTVLVLEAGEICLDDPIIGEA